MHIFNLYQSYRQRQSLTRVILTYRKITATYWIHQLLMVHSWIFPPNPCPRIHTHKHAPKCTLIPLAQTHPHCALLASALAPGRWGNRPPNYRVRLRHGYLLPVGLFPIHLGFGVDGGSVACTCPWYGPLSRTPGLGPALSISSKPRKKSSWFTELRMLRPASSSAMSSLPPLMPESSAGM